MRKILKALMDTNGHTGHSLYELSGVPPATTYRFLNGQIGEPKSGTIRRWARVYDVSEAQLRGTEPINDLKVEKQSEPDIPLKRMLTRDELAAIEGMRALDKDTRKAWLKIAKELANRHVTKAETELRRISSRGVSGLIGMKYRNPKQSSNGGIPAEVKKA